MVKIIQKENKILRMKAAPVLKSEITHKKVQNIIADMKKALEAEEDGIAIAAPQIGASIRLFVVSQKIHHLNKSGDVIMSKVPSTSDEEKKELVFINPVIIKLSKRKVQVPEGCLSVRWLYGDVVRSEKATIRAWNYDGKMFTRGASGLLAQVFQHETDHLDGILFTDKAKNLEEIKPDALKKKLNAKR